MPFRKLVALIVVAVLLGFGVAWLAVHVMRGKLSTSETTATAAPVEPLPPAIPTQSAVDKKPDPENPAFRDGGVYVTGWARRGMRINVTLSDGTVVSEQHLPGEDPMLTAQVGSSFFVVAGRKVPFRVLWASKPPESTPLPSVPQVATKTPQTAKEAP